ncbi:unnamed protein product [Rotaria sp. Silwood2]|nr:unnamed protein product [Rotaria sp. Silwood2]
MIDTGATRSLIKRSTLLRVNYHHHTYGTMEEITLGDGKTTFWQYGSINMRTKINNIKTRVKVMVVDDLAADFILGMDWIKYYHVDILPRKRQLRIHYRRQQIIVKFDEDVPVDVKVAQEYKIFPGTNCIVKVKTSLIDANHLYFKALDHDSQQKERHISRRWTSES